MILKVLQFVVLKSLINDIAGDEGQHIEATPIVNEVVSFIKSTIEREKQNANQKVNTKS